MSLILIYKTSGSTYVSQLNGNLLQKDSILDVKGCWLLGMGRSPKENIIAEFGSGFNVGDRVLDFHLEYVDKIPQNVEEWDLVESVRAMSLTEYDRHRKVIQEEHDGYLDQQRRIRDSTQRVVDNLYRIIDEAQSSMKLARKQEKEALKNLSKPDFVFRLFEK